MGKRNISLQIDEADVEAFDEFFSDRTEGRYSRSRELKRAMKLHHAVEKAIRDAPDRVRQRAVASVLGPPGRPRHGPPGRTVPGVRT
jgi:hypothetical protein